MQFRFHKYQGTGNDFIMIDDRVKSFSRLLMWPLLPVVATAVLALAPTVSFWCKTVLKPILKWCISTPTDVRVPLWKWSALYRSLCCCFGYYRRNDPLFSGDGLHTAQLVAHEVVALRMHDVNELQRFEQHYFLDTGSPHHVQVVEDLKAFPVVAEGRRIRQGAPYFEAGSNVNFVEQLDESTFAIRTYERGVEDGNPFLRNRSYSRSLGHAPQRKDQAQRLNIQVEGGALTLSKANENGYSAIDLEGPAEFVFEGTWG